MLHSEDGEEEADSRRALQARQERCLGDHGMWWEEVTFPELGKAGK